MELYVQFNPRIGGLIQERVILACDNNTSQIYTLQAKANMAELRIAKINGHEISKGEEVKRIFIQEAYTNIPQSCSISIKNEASVKVNYEWKFLAEQFLEKELEEIESQMTYKVEPEKGVIDADATLDFKITFQSKISIPFYKKVCLNINDIPIQAIRSPPDVIKKQSSQESLSNSPVLRPSLTYFEFEVVSEVKFNSITIDPPLYHFPAPLIINKAYEHTFVITSQSDAEINYSIRLHDRSSEYLGYDLSTTKVQIEYTFSFSRGKLVLKVKNQLSLPLLAVLL